MKKFNWILIISIVMCLMSAGNVFALKKIEKRVIEVAKSFAPSQFPTMSIDTMINKYPFYKNVTWGIEYKGKKKIVVTDADGEEKKVKASMYVVKSTCVHDLEKIEWLKNLKVFSDITVVYIFSMKYVDNMISGSITDVQLIITQGDIPSVFSLENGLLTNDDVMKFITALAGGKIKEILYPENLNRIYRY